jgi:hypothetical protein
MPQITLDQDGGKNQCFPIAPRSGKELIPRP